MGRKLFHSSVHAGESKLLHTIETLIDHRRPDE
jgi:hypothetical protein